MPRVDQQNHLRARAIKRASWFAIVGNLVLALLKLITGFVANSLAVLADGIDSTGDVLSSLLTLYIAILLVKPPNLKFPYGYGKAEPNATKALSFIIFFAGAQLAISSAKRLISGESGELPGKLAIVIMLISVIGKLLLALQQFRAGKRLKSSMLLANGKNMQGDVLISLSVLVGLICTHALNMPMLDVIAALAVSIWVMWVAIKIFIETNLELMDGNVGKDIYEKVFQAAESIPGVRNPHRMRIRRIGHTLMISIDIELDGNLSLHHAHDISHQVERQIKKEVDDVFDVVIHIEPYGDDIAEKAMGISQDSLKDT